MIAIRPIDIGSELTICHQKFSGEATRHDHLWGWNGTLDKLERLLAGQTATQL